MRQILLLLLVATGTLASNAAQQTGTASKVGEALAAQDMPAAMREYRVMIAADPNNAQAWTGLGVLLYGAGRASEAVEALTHALALDPASPRAQLFLSFSQADTGECGKALPVLEKYFDTQPSDKLQRLTGLTLMQCSSTSKDLTAALHAAAKLKQNYPGDADVLYESAELYTRMWTETADELLTAHPDSYRVHQLAAEVNEAQGNLERAMREYKAALGQNPALPQMHYRIGQLLLRTGDADADDKAMAEFHAELAINPQSAVSALAMAEIERHQGKLAEATTDYKHALTLEAGLPAARVGLAQTLLAQHQVDAAQAVLRDLLAEHPESAPAHYAMMLTYREQGKLQEAAAEMAIFQQLQKGSADQFQKKLDALLTGSTKSAAAISGPNP